MFRVMRASAKYASVPAYTDMGVNFLALAHNLTLNRALTIDKQQDYD